MMPYGSKRTYFEEYEELISSTREGKYLIASLFPEENVTMIKRRFERVSAAMGVKVRFHRGRYDNVIMSFDHPIVIDVQAELRRLENEKALKAAQPKKQRVTAQSEFRTALKQKARRKAVA